MGQLDEVALSRADVQHHGFDRRAADHEIGQALGANTVQREPAGGIRADLWNKGRTLPD